jgi:indolepyruvate ferredoxin oxidoreductase
MVTSSLPSTVTTPFSLDDRYLLEDGTLFLTGVQALVRVLADRARQDRRAGLRTSTFVSGYEGSPLAGYDLEIARQHRLLGGLDVVHRPGLNEEIAATSVMGSQLAGEVGELVPDGVTGFWYGKAPGLDRASDALRHANLIGTDPRGGAVALVGDDPAAKSSSVPCASELALADLAIPTLYPADSQDVLDYGLHAQYLSRYSGAWAALKVATAVADGASTARVSPDRGLPLPGLGPGTHRPSARLLGGPLMALERSLHEVRLPRALDYARHNGLNEIVHSGPRDRVGIVAAGKTYLDVREALTALGLDEDSLARQGIRLLKLGMIYPVDPEIVVRFAEGLDEVVVVEEKRAFLESAIKDVLYGRTGAPAVHGKRGADGRTLFSAVGELDADSVATGLARVLAPLGIDSVNAWRTRPRAGKIALPLLNRSPYFCSGCPHNSSTKAEADTLVGGGIGCHAMVLFMDPEQVGNVVGLTQMGGEGAQWIGIAPFVGERHFVQNIGDGTFLHSGSLAVRAAVAAGVDITYKLLYNSTVAMTGGQDAVGNMSVSRLAALLLSEGVSRVVVTTEDRSRVRARSLPQGVELRDRDDLADVQRELAAVPGVTVLIHDQECAAEKRRKRRRGKAETPAAKVLINERVCEGCGDCGAKSNCLSVHPVETEFGRKTRIHQSSCNVDYSCLDGDCPSFLTVVPGTKERREPVEALPAEDIPVPERSGAAEFSLRITGVGGTGVVTVAQILATAAVIEGKAVRTLDQTGLAQKGGAVVSDLKISDRAGDRAAKIGHSGCDLYLGCDALVATDPANLKAADPRRTVAVVSTTEVPTGHMVVNTALSFPGGAEIRTAVDTATREATYLNAAELAAELFGDEQYANMVLVGAALQTGALPVSVAALERAVTLNGVAVEANIQALRRGRQAVADPAGLRVALDRVTAHDEPEVRHAVLAASLAEQVELPTNPELAEVLRSRIADLVDYQDARYARSYAEFVAVVRRAEESAVPGSTLLTDAVVRYLYKLMAYKDEYEVARLSLDPSFVAGIEAEFGRGARYAHRLHPPILRALGMKKKIALGASGKPVFGVLKAMRRLRGTPLDVFGYAGLRRLERALVTEYRDSVTKALAVLTPETLALAAELASLPDLVRGYEHVKVDNVTKYRAELKTALTSLTTDQPLPV